MEINASLEQSPSTLQTLPQIQDARTARWVSNIASPPVLISASLLLTTAAINTPHAWIMGLLDLGLAVLAPAAFILWLARSGRISDFDVCIREQRWMPYLFTLGCGITTLLLNTLAGAPRTILLLLSISTIQTFLMFLINRVWKISVHTASAAAFAVILWQISGVPIPFTLWIVPLVAWSRLRLHRHTLGQAAAGAALGMGLVFSGLALFLQ